MTVENTEFCAVAGRMKAGADCANTLNDKTREMTLDQWIDFLEPKQEIKDATGKVTQAERGAAICQSVDDWNKMKTALEKACMLLKGACSYEIQEAIKSINKNTDTLQTLVKKKLQPTKK